MIRVVTIDDEASIRSFIKEKLKRYFSEEITIVGEADSVASGVKLVQSANPDLLLLDIHMEDGTGFDLLEQAAFKGTEVIFITGYDQHAIKAIKVGALDYILKPIDDDEFQLAIKKALAGLETEEPLDKHIEVSTEYYRGAKKKRVILKTTDAVYAVYEDDIMYCKSDGNYTTFYTEQDKEIMVSKALKKVEEILSEEVFVRCHQSYIVNKQYVMKYNKRGSLILNTDINIPVSARRKNHTIEKIFG